MLKRKLAGSSTWRLSLLTTIVLGLAIYLVGVTENPPGFYLDESSIAYNAYTISQTGRDEHQVAWPLFFRAFGEYKNPVYIYLLAAVFWLTGPSILVARLFTGLLGVFTALALGLLAHRISRNRWVGLIVAITALLTPWLFELTRLVLEVALFPLVLALFLLLLRRAMERSSWSWSICLGLAVTLGLVTYVYSIGRLFAPLLALGLLLFRKQAGSRSIVRVWLLYAVTLIPLIAYNNIHPGALGVRFGHVTYITPQTTYFEIAWEFVKHYVANFNLWWMLVTGDPRIPVLSIYGIGQILLPTFVLACFGVYLITRDGFRDPWWRFIIFGLLVSVVPASLTKEYFHILRLAPVPVFIIVLTIPALNWLTKQIERKRLLVVAVLVITVAQGSFYLWYFHRQGHSEQRLIQLDANYQEKIFEPAVAQRQWPIYLADSAQVPGYIHAYWYATLHGYDVSKFIKLGPGELPPIGALVITTETMCATCERLSSAAGYDLYISQSLPQPVVPLGDRGFRAQIEVLDFPSQLPANRDHTIRARVRNLGDEIWRATLFGRGRYQIALGNHWLSSKGEIVTNDDGRAVLLSDLSPGEVTEFSLKVTTPAKSGDYILELDMLQEEVSWFGLRGSQTLRLPVRVE